MKFQYVKLRPDAVAPTKAHPDDSGWDLTILGPHKRLNDTTVLYSTGIAVCPPAGFYFEIVPRSSISKKLPYHVLANSVGTIDASYRGELFVALRNFQPEMTSEMNFPCKLFQLILRPLIMAEGEEVEELSTTVRGAGGFGSTDDILSK